MWNIISTIVVGLIVGWLARFFYPGAVNAGWIMTILIGVGGSFLGTVIAGMFTKEKDMFSLKPAGFLMSIVGAVVLIFVADIAGLY